MLRLAKTKMSQLAKCGTCDFFVFFGSIFLPCQMVRRSGKRKISAILLGLNDLLPGGGLRWLCG